MARLDPDQMDGLPSYSIRREMPAEVLWNRVSVTASLFATAIGAALLLGRKR